MVEKMRAQGATPEALNQTIQEYEQFKEWYKNPFLRYAMTDDGAFPGRTADYRDLCFDSQKEAAKA